ncbi:MAG: ABC transporter permease [Candidatus Nanopelagicales bacterium]
MTAPPLPPDAVPPDGSSAGAPPAGAYEPSPGASSPSRRVLAHTGLELSLLLRNGEQLLLTLVIPLVLLVGLSTVGVVSLGEGARVDLATPGVLALAVLSTAFTAQAIATGFDRRSGALRWLGSTPLTRTGLLVAKTLAVLAIEVLQVVLIVAVALLLGWTPRGSWLAVAVLLLAGTAALSAWGLALAGVLRAEATLAVANGVFLLLLLAGGTVIPLDRLPDGLAAVVQWLPTAALGDALRDVLVAGAALPWSAVAILLGWAGAGALVVARTFRWT